MKLLSTIVIFCAVITYIDAGTYTNKYDNVNIDSILQNNRVLNNYIRCLMEEGPCTAEGRELKKTLPDALASNCEKCNEKQKGTAEKVIKHLMTNKARDWERLANKYDPEGKYKKRYATHLATKITNNGHLPPKIIAKKRRII